jgi:glucose-1-phosphate thymidylyltransferase
MNTRGANVFIPPVYVHENAHVENSIIGPNVAVGRNCSITRSILKDTIVDDNSTVTDIPLENSLIGKGSSVSGYPNQTIVADFEEIRLA